MVTSESSFGLGRSTKGLTRRAAKWSRSVADRLAAASAEESPTERAQRLGYVVHGEFGVKIAYEADVISDRVIETIEGGHYERFEGRRSKTFLADGDRVVELGAGLGLLSTLIMSSKKIADYQLVEADPRLPVVMERTHELNGVSGPAHINSCVATCNQSMIEDGKVDFHVGDKFCASSLYGARNLKHTVEVPVISLTELIQEHKSNVLIADIEGGEVDLFTGEGFDNIDKILMEIHPARIGQSGVREIFRDLDRLGFVFHAQASAGAVCGFTRFAD